MRKGYRPDSSYVREAIQMEKEKNQGPKPLPPKTHGRLTDNSADSNTSAQSCIRNNEGIVVLSICFWVLDFQSKISNNFIIIIFNVDF